ncbi:MAG TPA: hypothetical protein VK718_01330 [Ferruginibacter sp.]|jgi:hypothetical protein|nr:hypothetical protein [Ferruginibacter sp.]
MLTAEKVAVYKKYGGSYDGYYIHNRTDPYQIKGEWSLLEGLVQDLFLIRKGRASISYEENIKEKLRANCDSENTVDQIIKLEMFLNRDL